MSIPKPEDLKLAVLIPCYQEERTVAQVVNDFRRVLPQAEIYVYDNNCTDATARVARQAGAIVRREKRQGKGFVVASMFEQIDADILLMVDGDGTYDASAAPRLLEPLLNGDADMTVASRLIQHEGGAFRKFHLFGNSLVCAVIKKIFGVQITDIFSGYRGFTRQAAALIPITARGFDVETELTLQALYRGLVIKEIEAPYGARPEGSFSKLRTFSDGFLVLLRLFLMVKSYKPLTFFGSCSIGLFVLGLLALLLPGYEYLTGHVVHSVASGIAAGLLLMFSCFSLGLGLLLNSVNLRLLELERLMDKRMRKPTALWQTDPERPAQHTASTSPTAHFRPSTLDEMVS